MQSVVPINGKLPKHLAARQVGGSLAAARANVQGSFGVITIKGKNWWRKPPGGDAEIIPGDNGRPVQYLEVVIVGVSENVSQTYYEGGWVDGENRSPDCSSADGITPDPGVPNRQSTTCQVCPQNQWGSRQGVGGSQAKACQANRRIAVVPFDDILNETNGGPMMLRLPTTTLPNFRKYAELLQRKGVGDVWWVGTRLEFDPELSYPRITFDPIGYVTEEQDALIQQVQESPVLDQILVGVTPATPVVEDDDKPIPGAPPARATRQLAAAQSKPAPEPPAQAQAPAPARRSSPFQSAAKAVQQNVPAKAPAELNSMIDDLLGDQS